MSHDTCRDGRYNHRTKTLTGVSMARPVWCSSWSTDKAFQDENSGVALHHAMYLRTGWHGRVALSKPTAATIVGALPGAKLNAVYRLRVADLLDGGRATKLPSTAPIALAPGNALMALVAIYTKSPGRSHKFVWYYHQP